MNLTLREQDRRAVDLLLDRSPTAADGDGHGKTVYAAADPSLGQRVAQTQKLLQLLDALPAGEPPTDLVARTLWRVQQADQPRGTVQPMPNLSGAQRPLA